MFVPYQNGNNGPSFNVLCMFLSNRRVKHHALRILNLGKIEIRSMKIDKDWIYYPLGKTGSYGVIEPTPNRSLEFIPNVSHQMNQQEQFIDALHQN